MARPFNALIKRDEIAARRAQAAEQKAKDADRQQTLKYAEQSARALAEYEARVAADKKKKAATALKVAKKEAAVLIQAAKKEVTVTTAKHKKTMVAVKAHKRRYPKKSR